ncbi:hypothetical protein [Demequina sp. NBRC 110055]|uniref:hypothetical protein n=1 Tax=Demequina sp. NBRC 110055 TaxID=1570344 RepID=UPI0009FC2FDB|nr:hypothetical protein [Demequina sp. NBRC 110055]
MAANLPLARRTRRRVAVRAAVLAGLLALAVSVAMGFAHAGADASAGPVSGHHGVVEAIVDAGPVITCETCGEPEDGVALACLLALSMLAVLAVMRPREPLTVLLATRTSAPPVPLRGAGQPSPNLLALGICRT